jgi:hypothetical protein
MKLELNFWLAAEALTREPNIMIDLTKLASTSNRKPKYLGTGPSLV